MKKLFIMALAAASCTFISCGKKQAPADGADSTQVEAQAEEASAGASDLTEDETMERNWSDEPEQFDVLRKFVGVAIAKDNYMLADQSADKAAPIADLGAYEKTMPESFEGVTEEGIKVSISKEGDTTTLKFAHRTNSTNSSLMDEDGLIVWDDVMDSNKVFLYARVYNAGKTIAGYVMGKKFVCNAN